MRALLLLTHKSVEYGGMFLSRIQVLNNERLSERAASFILASRSDCMSLAVAFRPRKTEITIASRERRLNFNRRYATGLLFSLPWPEGPRLNSFDRYATGITNSSPYSFRRLQHDARLKISPHRSLPYIPFLPPSPLVDNRNPAHRRMRILPEYSSPSRCLS